MNKRIGAIAISVAGIAAAAAIGAGTYAAFSDSQTAPAAAQAGTLYLTDFGPASLADWEVTNLAPGQTSAEKVVKVVNGGTLSGNLTLTVEADGAGLDNGCAGGETGPEVLVDENCADDSDASELPSKLTLLVNVGGDAKTVELAESEDGKYTGELVDPQLLEANQSVDLTLQLLVSPDAGNEVQSDGANLTVTANLTQIVPQ